MLTNKGEDVTTEAKSPALLTTEEAAAYLRVHRDTLLKLWHQGKIKKIKTGRRNKYRRAELDAYIDRQTRTAK